MKCKIIHDLEMKLSDWIRNTTFDCKPDSEIIVNSRNKFIVDVGFPKSNAAPSSLASCTQHCIVSLKT